MGIARDRSNLSLLKKKDKKTIREYVQMWRNLTVQVHPPLLEKKMTNLFTNTFKMSYSEFLIGSASQHFINLVIVAKRIEQAIKVEKIKGLTVNSEIMMGYELENGSQIGNFIQLNLTVSSTAQTPLSKIDLPLPHKGIYQHPLNTGHITPLPSNPIKSPFPRWYNPNKKCEHHDGILNHLIKSYKNFRY